MHGIVEWIKSHPYLTGTLLLVILLFFVFRSKSNSSTATTATTGTASGQPDDSIQMAALTANAQIQGATLAAQTQIYGYQAAASVQNNQTAATVAQTAIAGSVADYQTAAELQLGLAQIGATPTSVPQPQTINPVYGQAQQQQGAVQAQQTTQATIAAATSVPAPSYTPAVLPSATIPGANVSLYQSSGNPATDASYATLETAEPNIPGQAYGTGPLPQVCYGNKCYGGPDITASTTTYDATQNPQVNNSGSSAPPAASTTGPWGGVQPTPQIWTNMLPSGQPVQNGMPSVPVAA